MNHFRTFIFIIILATCGYSPLILGQLDRPLTAQEISALQKNIEQNPENIKSRLFLGSHYFRLSNWKKVVEFLSPKAEKIPDSEIFKLATAYLNIEEYRQSEAMIGILLSREEIDTITYLLAVDLYSKLIEKVNSDDQKKVIVASLFDTLKSAKAKDPTNPKIYDAWLEQLELHIPHYATESLRVVEDMKKNEIPFETKHYSLLCKYNYLAEFTKETKTTCLKAISLDPDNPSNFIYLGQTHVNIGEEKEGKRMLASVGEKFSKSEEALWASANSYHQSKNISEAYKFYKKASEHKDAKPRDFLGLGQTAFELKKYGEALEAFTQHCYRSRILHHEFRRASGLLLNKPVLQDRYREKMQDCKPKSPNPNE